MSENTVETPQEQPKVETQTGMDRLSSDALFNDIPETKTQEIPLETKPIENEVVGDVPKTETPLKEGELVESTEKTSLVDDGFKDDETTILTSDEGTWKAYLESNNIPIPEDFSEDKGFEVVLAAKEAEIASKYEEKLLITKEDILADYTPEARLVIDLMAKGISLEEINAPINEINRYKSMSKEELVRENLSGLEGYTEDMVDHKMESLISEGKLDMEYQILINGVNHYEKQIHAQRAEQLKQYTQSQNTLKEQKRQQDLNSFKSTLDKMPTFMDKSLKPENKAAIINDYSNGVFDKLMQDPAKKAEYMLYVKYGKQALQYAQAKAIEDATLKLSKQLHNVPPVTGGNLNVTQTTKTTGNTGIDRLDEIFGK